jgi:hypothetical protein
MIEAHKLAGFVTAHGIWSVGDGSPLIPIYAYVKENGERILNRLATDTLENAVALGREKLASNEDDANDAVLVFDARIPIGDLKYDALIVEIKSYFSPQSKAVMAIPYSPANESHGFKVHKPKYLQWIECDDFNLNTCVNSFFSGVDTHEKAAQFWNDHLDQSV